jgi:hypothetical protein
MDAYASYNLSCRVFCRYDDVYVAEASDHTTGMMPLKVDLPVRDPHKHLVYIWVPYFFDETNSHNFVKLNPDNMVRGINWQKN